MSGEYKPYALSSNRAGIEGGVDVRGDDPFYAGLSDHPVRRDDRRRYTHKQDGSGLAEGL